MLTAFLSLYILVLKNYDIVAAEFNTFHNQRPRTHTCIE